MNNKITLGALLDCSRNAVVKPAVIKDFILKLEKAGYNLLQLYTEDTYSLEGEPYFGSFRGRFSKDEIKGINDFAKSHGIELMPCIETLGHLEKIFEWEEYKGICDIGGVILAGCEKTYALIDKMFAFCAECFTSERINIGFDEAHMLGLGNYLKHRGYRDAFDIFTEHLKKVCAIAEKYSFKPVIWSDMFFRIAFDGEYPHEDGELPSEITNRIPENVGLAYWDYFSLRKETYEKMLDKHLSLGREVWFAGSAVKCCGFHSANAISVDRLTKGITACMEKGIKNILVTMWGDGGNECSFSTVLPSVIYAAEIVKGNHDMESIKEIFKKITGEEWDDFMLFDLADNSIPRQDDIGTGAKELLYSDYFCGRFNGAVSDNGAERKFYFDAAAKFAIAEKRSLNYKYLFGYYKALCDVLACKYDLGYLCRKYYLAGDKKSLGDLCARFYETEKLLKIFIEKFREFWYKENKGNGLEIHEIRLGGVLVRTQSCRKRIEDYITGKISEIEELNEDFPDKDKGKYLPFKNDYRYIASVNTL